MFSQEQAPFRNSYLSLFNCLLVCVCETTIRNCYLVYDHVSLFVLFFCFFHFTCFCQIIYSFNHIIQHLTLADYLKSPIVTI
jgi:hypothetical protein